MHSLTHSNPKIQSSCPPTILAIENDEDNLAYLVYALDLLGYHCIPAQDSITGLRLAQEYQPDLILLDIKIPQVSGFELKRILQLDWLTRRIPVVAVTGLAREEERKLILDAGFIDYLLKPYLLEDLEHIVGSRILNTSFR